MNTEEINKYMDENEEKIKRWVAWADYYIGFTGVGTTALDTKPNLPIPDDLPLDVIKELKNAGREWARYKWEIWCKASDGVDVFVVSENWKCPKFLEDENEL